MDMSGNNPDQMDQNAEGGLFSDDYEAPKKENPYLKKNREKVRTEERAHKAPAVTKPRRIKSETPSAVPDPAEEGQGYTHKRTFSDWLFEHIKLIAAIATVLVVLSLVLITDVVGVVERIITQTQQADKEAITLTYVKGLSELGQPITWGHLDKFRRDETGGKDSVTWMLEVEGTDYELWVSGVSTEKPPVYVYLFHMRTGDRLVLGEEDFDAFIESHSK
jgi:hypothetical protein